MPSDRTAADVFALLADDTRVDVLRAVAVAQRERGEPGDGMVELSFSEIYDRVDVEGTSKLSYHLGELAGTLLRKGEGGYSLTYAGEKLARFVLSGNYDRPPVFGPEPASGICPFCGADDLEASLYHQFFVVECASCDRPVSNYTVTPAQARSHDAGDLVRSVKRAQAAAYARIRRGTCPECAGRLATTVRDPGANPLPDADPFVVFDRCEECLRAYNAPLSYGAAYHPASVAFHWDRGVDVTTKGLWEFHDHLRAGRWTAERTATDPAEYEVVLRRGDDALRFALDSDAVVRRTERVRRASGVERQNDR